MFERMETTTIGYVCADNPFTDRKAWSGLIYKIRESIEQAGFDLVWIPYRRETVRLRIISLIKALKRKAFGRNLMDGVHCEPMVREYARTIDMSLVDKCDYLFFPGGAQISLFLKTEKPVIYYTDATVHVMEGYYWKNIEEKSMTAAKQLEERASRHAFLNIRASQWAIDSVVNDSHSDKANCHVLEFGPNIDIKDVIPITPYGGGRFQILFSGVDWERKGGAIAVETVRLLRAKGLDAYLTVVGPSVCPKECVDKEYVIFLGFLDKNLSEDYTRYINLWQGSHLFLLPTKAECAGVVFSEASAFGIPSYTYATGGTTNYVVNDCNGYAFAPDATADDFAEKIFSDLHEGRLSQYHANALKLHHEKLSWEAWSKRFRDLIRACQ